MKCLEKGEVCKYNFKCKVCKLTDCKNTMQMIEEDEKMYYQTKEQKFIEEMQQRYPSCVNCSHLEILNMEQGKVRCSYMINKRCALGGNYVSKSNR